MNNLYKLYDSTRADKKFMIINPKGKKIHFGAKGYEDYIIHKDDERKQRYIARHQNNEDWTNLDTPGFWARWLLWNKPTIKQSILDIDQRFDIEIEYDAHHDNI